MSLPFETEDQNGFGRNRAGITELNPPRRSEPPTEPAYQVIRRNGSLTPFDPSKITVAVTKAFLAVEGPSAGASRRVHETVDALSEQVVSALQRRVGEGRTFHIEDIQDQVELALMRGEHHKVARAYVLYRDERSRERAAQALAATEPAADVLHVRGIDGTLAPLDLVRLTTLIEEACAGLPDVSPVPILTETRRNLYDGISIDELAQAPILAARTLIETEPNYSEVSARLLLDILRREALTFINGAPDQATQSDMNERYAEYFPSFIKRGIAVELLDPELARYDVKRIAAALRPERDLLFQFLGLQTLYDRYFLQTGGIRFELPQAFFMRVAMGLAQREIDREAKAIEFYELISSFDFMCSTPTLFNSGTVRPQLSSCFLTTISDDLEGIFKGIQDNALLAKYSGGLGNDWSRVRGLGAHIKGTNGQSQGVVPFLKVANDTAIAVNQCFAPDTLIHTADGPKPIRDARVGDLVLGISGKYRQVTDKFIYNQTDPMVEISVKHSIEPIQVTSGHPFHVIRGVPLEQTSARTMAQLTSGKRAGEWVDAGELRTGDYMAQVIPAEVVPAEGFETEDARLYGVLLGDGHMSKDGMQWGVSGNPSNDIHLEFVRAYLDARGIHYWQTIRGESYAQIHWASGRGVLRDGTTGRITGAGAPTMPFSHDDLYDEQGRKRISRRLSHLPRAQTVALVQGLLETDGGVSRGKEIYFSNTSRMLAEGLRYQMLRLGVPTAGQFRTRDTSHDGRRSDGTAIRFDGETACYDVRVPAVPEIAELVGCQPLTKRNWISWNGAVYSRIRSVRPTEVKPFVFDLEVEGDESYMTTSGLAHNGGKRKGAVCAYLETWHIDIDEFLDLRKNTGDDRRRTHDMNTANWVPDLFMQRVEADQEWTLFSPNEVPDLHDAYGPAFERLYTAYEEKADRGEIKVWKRVHALDLWRKMLTMLFETGHPWITFKDACNLRSPQQHVGVVHSSNLCTEITLNTSDDEVAVCNLGSVNLANHTTPEGLDHDQLQSTVNTAMRMLDNVVDINFYTIPEARRSNLKHRPVGLGIMGFQDALHTQRIPFGSDAAVAFADTSMEAVSYHAIAASVDLAAERGKYPSFDGSLWSKGILPLDSIELLAEARGGLELDRSSTLDWASLRERVVRTGMRNSNTMAIAPTATISNICGVAQSIEPAYRNLYVKSNMSGDFTVVTPALVRDLKARDLWDPVMVSDLKYFDGSLGQIDRVPEEVKALYATAFEIDTTWLIESAARRQKWIDQSQSLNLYLAAPSGRKLDQLYRHAWNRGLKTTYYLRTQSATHVEKSTLKGTDGKLNNVALEPAAPPAPAVPVPPAPVAPPVPIRMAPRDEAALTALLDDPVEVDEFGDMACEACQ